MRIIFINLNLILMNTMSQGFSGMKVYPSAPFATKSNLRIRVFLSMFVKIK